jgi:hypothetical protein
VRTLLNAKRQPQHRIPDRKPLHFRDLPHEHRKCSRGDTESKSSQMRPRKSEETARCCRAGSEGDKKKQVPGRRFPPTCGCRP